MGEVEDGQTLYVVPQQRTFVWPTVEIGRKVTVPHVKTPLGELLRSVCDIASITHRVS